MTNRSEYTVNMQDINRNPVYDYNRNSDATETFGSTDVSVDYQHSTHKKDELLTISYRFSHSPNDNKDYTELKNVVNYNPWLGYPQNNINKASTNEHTGQVDYTTLRGRIRPWRLAQNIYSARAGVIRIVPLSTIR